MKNVPIVCDVGGSERERKKKQKEESLWPFAESEMDLFAILNFLSIGVFKELHYNVKGLKNIRKLINEKQQCCRDLTAKINSIATEYESIRLQVKNKVSTF